MRASATVPRIASLAAVVLTAAMALASPSLFSSRVAYEPLVAKLEASGGDASRIVHARTTQDLLRLQSGKRYKIVVDATGGLAIAPLPADAPNNEYVHPILAAGGPVRTAGGRTASALGAYRNIVVRGGDTVPWYPWNGARSPLRQSRCRPESFRGSCGDQKTRLLPSDVLV